MFKNLLTVYGPGIMAYISKLLMCSIVLKAIVKTLIFIMMFFGVNGNIASASTTCFILGLIVYSGVKSANKSKYLVKLIINLTIISIF